MTPRELLHRRQITVHYPAGRGRIVLRTELDWKRDIEPLSVSDDGERSSFELAAPRPYLYFKACLRSGDGAPACLRPRAVPHMFVDRLGY